MKLLTQTLEPVTAGRGSATCGNDGRSITGQVLGQLAAPLGLPVLPVSANIIGAQTTVDGAGESQSALAQGGLADLKVSLANLPALIPLPPVTVPDALKSISIPTASLKSALQSALNPLSLPGPINDTINGIPDNLTVDLQAAVNALLPNGQLPTGDLLNIQGAMAYATGTCQNGKPVLGGTSRVLGIKVLGQEVPVNQVLDRTVSLIDTGNIDPSALKGAVSLDSVLTGPLAPVLALGGAATVVNNTLTTLLNNALDALPTIKVLDPTTAQVKITPGSQSIVGDKLIQQGPRVFVSVLGQTLIDGVIGEATMAKGDVDCKAAVAGQGAVQAQLECTKRRLVLTDVVESGGKVKLIGVADPKLAGKTVNLVFEATNKVVAHAKVSKAGNFSATAPMPARALRGTNRARYQAVVGKEKSLDLKLRRRMLLSTISSKNGKVTIVGRVVRPMANPSKTITLTRRISCKKSEVVARFKPKADGTFRITIKAPKGAGAAVYRLATQVRKNTRNPKLYPTFTLPRAVDLER